MQVMDDYNRHIVSPLKPINFPEIIIGRKLPKSPSKSNNISVILGNKETSVGGYKNERPNSKISKLGNDNHERPYSKKPKPTIVLFEKYNTPVRKKISPRKNELN